MIDSVARDVRQAGRQFARRPLSTLTMVLVLALGLGFASAVFIFLTSLESGPPAGVRREPSLVRIRGTDRSRGPGRTIGREFGYAEYRGYASQSPTFGAVAAWASADVTLGVGRDARDLRSGAVTYVTANYFPLLELRLALGAGLPADADDDGEPLLAGVISHVVWDRFYDKAPDIVGQTLTVNGIGVTIAGVAPRTFIGARTGGSAVRVWLPLSARRVVAGPDLRPDDARFGLIARLQPGVDLERATPVVRTIAAQFESPGDASRQGRNHSADVVPLLARNYFPPSGEAPGGAGRIVGLSIPVLVLLITSTNVSALLAGMAVARRREIAVRLALGAHRLRIVRQLLTETALLALAAGALGLAVIGILLRAFDATVLDAPLVFDWRAGVFTSLCALITSFLFGLSPALHATRFAVADVLKESEVAVSRSRLLAGLVVAQIALTQPALLSMGALLMRLQGELREQPASAFADQILEVRFNTNPRYGAMDERREEILRRLQTRLAELPGVVGVVGQAISDDDAQVSALEAQAAAPPAGPANLPVRIRAAPPGYFALTGRSIVRGREFTAADARSADAIVVGETLARRLWGSADPVGRRLVADAAFPPSRAGRFTVVGVAGDPPERAGGGTDAGTLTVFVPDLAVTGHFLVRTQGRAESAVRDIRAVAQTDAREAPIVSVRTLAAIEAEARGSLVRSIMMAGGCGLLALSLAAIGLYAVVAFAVAQRVREIGIRAALGADRRRIVRLFLSRGLAISLAGLSIGLALSAAAVRLISAADGAAPPAGLAGLAAVVAAFVMAVALVAAWIPARRAAVIDPLAALRTD